MKKTLAAVAILGAFAGSAMADVTVYGRLNTGFAMSNQTIETAAGVKVVDADKFSMNSGDYTGSRLGFKGTEDLGNGTKVGFVLESDVKSDTGAATFFGRESVVTVQGAYGKFGFGKTGTITKDSQSFAKWASFASVVGTGTAGVEGVGLFALAATRWDNMISYETPRMAGVQAYAQYSLGTTDNESVGNDRYAAIGADYKAGGFQAGFTVEQVNKKGELVDANDMYTFNVGGTYALENGMKFSMAAQYFKDATDFGGLTATLEDAGLKVGSAATDEFDLQDLEGYGVNVGYAMPLAGGQLRVNATYVDGDSDALDADAKVWHVGGVYDYRFSKNVLVYLGAGYINQQIDLAGEEYGEAKKTYAELGMVYYF